MANFRQSGATIFMVSHNLSSIETLCTRAAWLEQGVVRAIGLPGEVVWLYRHGGVRPG
jgi:ABC-type polysaccharide/polyol phosphate transport system ATPase subunit